MVEPLVQQTTVCSRHLTLRAAAAEPPLIAARAVFDELARELARNRLVPFQDKCYGSLEIRDEVLALRNEAFVARGLPAMIPCTWIAGRPDEEPGFIGVQVWGIEQDEATGLRIRSVEHEEISGRLCEGPDGRMLWLSSVHGLGGRSGGRVGVAEQAWRMFERAEAALQAWGFGFGDVVRTWIHLARLLDWYGEFNRVRSDFLGRRGIHGGRDGRPYPASTGIQGSGGEGDCVLDLLAVDGLAARPIHATSRQDRPLTYGSSFSRGMVLDCFDQRQLLISGTASIDAAGHTRHCWKREAQILETLLGVAALCEDQGGSLHDIVQGTLFCKDRETLETYHRIVRQLGLPPLPLLPVLADVCRHELMVEIEAVAVVPRDPRPTGRVAARSAVDGEVHA